MTPKDPTTTPKFVRTHSRINLKIIDYKTNVGEALYKRTARSIYPDSEGKFELTS